MQCTDKVKEEIIKHIEKNMTERRKTHIYAVAEEAKKLAQRYGVDMEKAELAALFHDIFRNVSVERLNDYVKELKLNDRYLHNPNLAHSKVAAAIMEKDYHIYDRDLINAVSYHTTGRANMSYLEKIIFLADAIEPNRNYPCVDKIRSAAYRDLNQACLLSLENSIKFIKSKNLYLDNDTLMARDCLLEKIQEYEKETSMINKEITMKAAAILSKKKALDIVIIDISMKSSFADYFVIASGSSERQVGNLSEEIEEQLAKEGVLAKSIEGKKASGWILMDYGDVIINIFSAEQRDRYNIEKLWGDGVIIPIDDDETPLNI